jgi:EmrB/QacA subfamily drug resistance transporter
MMNKSTSTNTINTLGARRWWALGALILAVLAVGLDTTVLSLAIPTLATALHASESELQWFVASYALVLAAAMLPAGLLGDRFGRKKVILGSLILFGLDSVACAYAPSPSTFIAARAVLGVAGAGLVTMSLSVLTVLFSEEERPRAVGIWAAANFLAFPIGPILGGWLLAHYWWGWVFLINVPVVVLGLIAVLVLLPESRSAERLGLDPVGVLSSSAGLVGLTYGIIEAGQNGWGDVSALVPLIAGAIILVAFMLWELRLSHHPSGQPLIDPALFRSRSFTWGTLLASVGSLAMLGVLFTIPQYFQAILGKDAQDAGLRLLPLIAGVIVGVGPADRLAARAGAKVTVALGFALLAAGLIIGATTSVSSSDGFIAAWTALCGAGMGLALSTAASAALSELSAERSGVGSAVMQAVQKLGAPFGAAILGSALNSVYQSNLNVNGLPAQVADATKKSVFAGVTVAHKLGSASLLDSVRTAFVDGMDVALWVAAGVAGAGVVLALVFLPRRRSEATMKAAAEQVQ